MDQYPGNPQEKISIGDCERTAFSITCWSWIRSSRLWTNVEQTVFPFQNRPSSSSNGVDLELANGNLQSCSLVVERNVKRRPVDSRNVRRGTAHVETNQRRVLVARLCHSNDSSGRTRQNSVDTTEQFGIGQPSVTLHELHLGNRAERTQKLADFVEINGAQLAYFTLGDGPLVITLHGGRGFGSKNGDFKAYSRLADHGYKVVSFDFRGHGNSSFTPPFTFAQIVDDIDAVREHFAGKDGKVIVIGGSFGGFLAQQYATTYPSNISHLILRGTAPSHHHEEDAFKVLEQKIPFYPGISLNMLRKVFGRFESDLEMQLVMFALAPLYSESYNSDEGLAGCLKTKYRAESHNSLYAESEKYFDYTNKLALLETPTLIIVGEKDWICPPSQSRRIAQLVRNSTLVEVPDANHSVHLEKTDQSTSETDTVVEPVGVAILRSLSGWEQVLLERSNHGLSNNDHGRNGHCTQNMVLSARNVAPSCQNRSVATVHTAHNVARLTQRDVVDGALGGHNEGREQHQTNSHTGQASLAGQVADKSSGQHGHQVHSGKNGWKVVDVADGVSAERFQVQFKELEHVGGSGKSPETVADTEGPQLPREHNRLDVLEAESDLCRNSSVFHQPFLSTVSLPFVQVESAGVVRVVWQEQIAVDDHRGSNQSIDDEHPLPRSQSTLTIHGILQTGLDIRGSGLSNDTGKHKEVSSSHNFTFLVPTPNHVVCSWVTGGFKQSNQKSQRKDRLRILGQVDEQNTQRPQQVQRWQVDSRTKVTGKQNSWNGANTQSNVVVSVEPRKLVRCKAQILLHSRNIRVGDVCLVQVLEKVRCHGIGEDKEVQLPYQDFFPSIGSWLEPVSLILSRFGCDTPSETSRPWLSLISSNNLSLDGLSKNGLSISEYASLATESMVSRMRPEGLGNSLTILDTLATNAAVLRGVFVFVSSKLSGGRFLMDVLMLGMDDSMRWNMTAPPWVATALSIPLGLPWQHFSPIKAHESTNRHCSESLTVTSSIFSVGSSMWPPR
ncbi:hypothetical protein OGAPHI_006356 [Ogataea philodendri]|uniref:AB hydrolase-1 domain-containing protein n=1 Tax=Ogataea philodendri TaxID=1378263 RepID=A0A9P8NXZ7_9ASCO|nr:uncharacterized protein OGAPHI_006356 [Ogataea philodendri]KAH3661509.1 hypothetical protein OGAPHI_006356 [Ogataea philodendri]